MKYIDLTHTFRNEMPAYSGDPIPKIKQIASLHKHGYVDHSLCTGMHVGTHIDAPRHMIKDGKTIPEILPEQFFGRGHLIDVRGKNIFSKDCIEERNIEKGDIVIFMTGFYKKYGKKEYFKKYPVLSEELAHELVKKKIYIVGVDTPSPDRDPYNVHKILLGNDILIIENLTNLHLLVKHKNFEILALPVKFDTEAAPVRVLAKV